MKQPPKIACLPKGPYYLLNDMTAAPVPNLRRANGEPCATVRGVALCRCGGSRNKPFCDGTHSLIGFKDQRSANATPNRRESYAGRRITIHDNRGICSRRLLHRPPEVGLPDAGGALDRCRSPKRP